MSELPVDEDDFTDYRDCIAVEDNQAERGKMRTQELRLLPGCRVIDLYSYLFHEIPAGATVTILPDDNRLRLTWRP